MFTTPAVSCSFFRFKVVVLTLFDFCMVLINLSLVTRKPVFGICDKRRLKPTYAATEVR